MTNFRALCVELHAAFTTYAVDECHHNLLERTRAALADEPASVTEQPTVMQLIELSYEIEDAGLGQIDFARAVLARWGNPAPQPPAEGEVAKPVAWMCPAEPYFDGNKWHDRWQATLDQRLAEYWARPGKPTPLFTRAAELLQREALVPVSVSERLPAPEDCDAEHYCWRWNTIGGLWARQPLARRWYEFESHWLPATALPLPTVND